MMVTAVIPTVGVPLILNRSVVVSATATVSAAPPSFLIFPEPRIFASSGTYATPSSLMTPEPTQLGTY